MTSSQQSQPQRLGTVEVAVPARFCGPPGTANGGWVCGTVASALQSASALPSPSAPPPPSPRPTAGAVVRLRAATPIETPLVLDRDGGAAQLRHGDRTLVEATALSGPDAVGVPPPNVAFEVAAAATAAVRFEGAYHHPFPGCFVCGHDRAVGDGLRIFPGSHPELPAGTVAGTWRVDESLADGPGSVPDVFVWAALDCASYWAHRARSGEVFGALLAQLAATVTGQVTIGGEYVVVARADEADGRKLWGTTALYDQDGGLVGQSRALWIRLPEDPPRTG